MTSALPVSARTAWWGTAWLRGQTAPDDLLAAVHDGGLPHLVAGPGPGGESLIEALARLRDRGATVVGAAFPAEGDPVGLGGPADFNRAALERGEAVVVADARAGLVPLAVGPSYQWSVHEARPRPLADVGEADRALRAALLEAAERLAALDVARWRPEVADELVVLDRPTVVTAPPGVPPRCVELAGRALRATAITDLALADDGGALTAADAAARREALLPLARAGRRALTAACSPEVWPPG